MSRLRVIVTEPINVKGVEGVELHPGSKEEDLLDRVGDADGLITRGSIKVTREMMERSNRLRVVGVHGIGCDNVDLKAAEELGRVVCNTPDALTVTVAEGVYNVLTGVDQTTLW
jgi:D-3-phosphoglycerate dehydrogenase